MKIAHYISFLAVSCLYIFCANADTSWFDTAEITTSVFLLDSTHPPGHPFYINLAHLFTWLPLGSVGFRLTLMSVACSAGAIVLGLRMLPQNLESPLVTLAALTLAVHPALMLQSIRPEVYALNFLTTLIIFFILHRGHRDILRIERSLYAAWFVFGLGLANHHFLGLLCFPFLAWHTIQALSLPFFRWQRAFWCILFGLMPLSLYLFVPIRAASTEVLGLSWGEPTNITSFFHFVAGADYQAKVTAPWQDFGSFNRVLKALRPDWVLLGLVGFALLIKLGNKAFVALLVGAIALFAGGLVNTFNPENPDQYGYLGCLAIILGIAIFGAALRGSLWFKIATLVLLLAAGGYRSYVFHHPLNRFDNYLADSFAYDFESRAPYGSTLLASSDHALFSLTYRQRVWNMRPDIAIVSPRLLEASWYRDKMQERYPRLKFTDKSKKLYVDGKAIFEFSGGFKSIQYQKLNNLIALDVWHVAFATPDISLEPNLEKTFLEQEYQEYPNRYRLTGEKIRLLRYVNHALFYRDKRKEPRRALNTLARALGKPLVGKKVEFKNLPKLILMPKSSPETNFILNVSNAMVELTILYLRSGSLDLAEEVAIQANKRGNPNGVLFVANAYLAKGESEKAKLLIELITPDYGERASALGVIELQKGDTKAAEVLFRQALRLDKRITQASLMLAKIEESKGNRQNAQSILEQSFEITQDAKIGEALIRLQKQDPL